MINTDVDLQEFVSIAEEKKDQFFVLFTPKQEIYPKKNLLVLPITDYGNVPKHVKDLKLALNNL